MFGSWHFFTPVRALKFPISGCEQTSSDQYCSIIAMQRYFNWTHLGRVTHICLAVISSCNLFVYVHGHSHDDVIKWKHFPCYWPFVRGIHRSPVNSLHIGQWRRALMFSLISVSINSWENNREAGDLRSYCAHYDVIVMPFYAHGILKLGNVDPAIAHPPGYIYPWTFF